MSDLEDELNKRRLALVSQREAASGITNVYTVTPDCLHSSPICRTPGEGWLWVKEHVKTCAVAKRNARKKVLQKVANDLVWLWFGWGMCQMMHYLLWRHR